MCVCVCVSVCQPCRETERDVRSLNVFWSLGGTVGTTLRYKPEGLRFDSLGFFSDLIIPHALRSWGRL